MSKIVETIHHGGYRNVRTVELDPSHTVELVDMLNECLYVQTHIVTWVRTLQMALESGGSYSRGWVTWEVER